MPWSDPEPQMALGVCAPPYRDVAPAPRAAGARLARGTLLILDVRSLAEDGERFPRAVADARARHPAAPVILRVAEVTADTLRGVQRATRLGVRAVVGRDELLAEVLRPLLTQPDDLAGDLLEWLGGRGHSLSPRVAALARTIVELAPRYARLRDLLRAAGQAERTVRHLFRSAAPQAPRRWHQGARALHAALRLQARPEAPIQALARDLGYSDHSGLTRQVTRAFGVTPAAIQGTLGWEWLAERWRARDELKNLEPS